MLLSVAQLLSPLEQLNPCCRHTCVSQLLYLLVLLSFFWKSCHHWNSCYTENYQPRNTFTTGTSETRHLPICRLPFKAFQPLNFLLYIARLKYIPVAPLETAVSPRTAVTPNTFFILDTTVNSGAAVYSCCLRNFHHPEGTLSNDENPPFVQQNTGTVAIDQARFPLVSYEEILEISETAASKNTARATKTWMAVWAEWCQARNINVNVE